MFRHDFMKRQQRLTKNAFQKYFLYAPKATDATLVTLLQKVYPHFCALTLGSGLNCTTPKFKSPLTVLVFCLSKRADITDSLSPM